MSSSVDSLGTAGKDAQENKKQQQHPSPPPSSEPIPEGTECHMKGVEDNFEVLAGVEHGRLRRYYIWSTTTCVYVCDECRVRLGQSLAETPKSNGQG
ncbi:hypothetical protein GGR51DRAFT_32165 [Nemania sp. FL0031]|nr:hypothetical protein GGR51DRAFT_32165 [Nemania sp. FL0031]